MASTSNSKNKIPEFASDFGDMSPLKELRGPKTPSNRQVLRLFLFFFSLGNTTLQAAATSVVTEVLKKHTTSVCKKPRTLADDVLALYKEARYKAFA